LKSAVAASILALTVGAPLHAQLTVGAGGSTVQYDGSSGLNAVGVNPDLLFTSSDFLFNATGRASTASDGSRWLQGGTRLWVATPPIARHLQWTGLVEAQGIDPQGEVASSEALAFSELAFTGGNSGVAVGAGGAHGWISGEPSVGALRLGARGWLDAGPASLAASVQPTRLDGSWFTDYQGSLELGPGPFAIFGGVTLRQITATPASAGVDAAVYWRATPRMTLETSAGHYLRDPYQGLPAGWYVNAGVRFTLWAAGSEDLGAGANDASLTSIGLMGASDLFPQRSTPVWTAPSTTGNPTTSGGTSGNGGGSTGSGNTHGNPGRGHRP
jgi:hypothetical protein